MANFIIEFPLKTELYHEHVLDKRFNIARQIQNALLNVVLKRYNEMVKTKKYRTLRAQLTKDKDKNDPIWKQLFELANQYRMGKFYFEKDVKTMQKHFKKNIDAHAAQKIAAKVWDAFKAVLYEDGEDIHFIKYGQMNSIECKTNQSGIRYIQKNGNDYILWLGLLIPIDNKNLTIYEWQALRNPVSYCRLKRRYIRGKYKYYVQLVLKGVPPLKYDNETGEIKHCLGAGNVGIDIGTSTVAVVSKTDTKLLELANKVQNIEKEKRRILRKMDRSQRAMNPDNYNPNGTIKNQGSRKVVWVKSNHYIKLQAELRELYRKQADIRKYQHYCLVNQILEMGDTFYVEKMNFKALMKRAKKTEKDESGKNKRKKRFGKSIGNRAPAMFLTLLDQKLKACDTLLIKINTQKAKASQFNHIDKTCKKKKLRQRWNYFEYNGNTIKVQRDLYSAFLIMNISSDLKSFDIDECNEKFDNFLVQHDKEVQRLKLNASGNEPRCMGIW